MPDHLDNLAESVKDCDNLLNLIKNSNNTTTKCDSNDNFMHKHCIETSNNEVIPQCPAALQYVIIKLLATKPKLFVDEAREEVAEYYKSHNIKAKGFIHMNYLTILSDQTKEPTLTWIKFENLLTLLIKRNVYEPKVVANEILRMVRDEIPPKIATKLASVLEACVKYCREVNVNIQDEEEEEKWCEIIDWMSWFLGSSDQL